MLERIRERLTRQSAREIGREINLQFNQLPKTWSFEVEGGETIAKYLDPQSDRGQFLHGMFFLTAVCLSGQQEKKDITKVPHDIAIEVTGATNSFLSAELSGKIGEETEKFPNSLPIIGGKNIREAFFINRRKTLLPTEMVEIFKRMCEVKRSEEERERLSIERNRRGENIALMGDPTIQIPWSRRSNVYKELARREYREKQQRRGNYY